MLGSYGIAARTILAPVLVLAVLSALPAVATAAEGGGTDLSIQLQEELEAVLKKKAKALYEEKDADGLRFQRGTYAKKFHSEGEAYTVAFTKDTADGGRLRTERYLLTLEKSESGGWEITGEELQDTYENMIREMPGDEKFYRFASMHFDAEGMKVSSGPGTMILDSMDGKVHQVLFTADDLAYEYSPPADLSYNQNRLYRMLQKRHKEDFIFNPELAILDCDPVTCRFFLEDLFEGMEETGLDSVAPSLQKFYREAEEDQRKARKDRVFSGFRLPHEPDRIYYRMAIKKNNRSHWLALRYDSYEPWEVAFIASRYGYLYGYISEQARKAGVNPYDVERRDDLRARYYQLDAVSGTVEIALKDPEILEADLHYSMTLKRDRREIPFYLRSFKGFGGKNISEKNPSITINALETGDGKPLSWMLTGPSYGYVIFPEKVKAGTRLDLHMQFENRGSILKLTPSYSYMDRGGWLPFVQFTDKLENFEMTVKVPSKYKALGCGTLISEKVEDGVHVSHWKAFNPLSFPTVIFGDYYHDKPKIKATKMDGTEIPVNIYVDKDGMADWEIRGKQLRPLAEQAVNSLNLFREIFGIDYPYGKLDLVNDPLGFLYGQSPASIIYLGSGVFRGEGMLASLRTRDSTGITRAIEEIVPHEVGHQWWGSIIGNANMRNYWFIESVTEYAAALFVEALASESGKNPEKGWKAYLDKVGRWREFILDTDLMTSVQDSTAVWSGEVGPGYVAAIYNKGPYALHILRMTFGMEKMNAFLKDLAQEFAYKEIVTRDIQRIAEKSFGADMDWWFDQWIRGVGMPQYSFNYEYRQTEDRNYLVEGTIRQRVVVGYQKEELPGIFFTGVIPVTVLGRDKKEYSVRIFVEGEETPFAFKVPVEPVEITFNKYGETLAHDILENRGW